MANPAPNIPITDQNRIIYCSGEFGETEVNNFITKLMQFELQDYKKDILVIINSYGGFVDGFIAMYDAIKLCRCNVATLCLGKAMSAGCMLLLSGTKGKRFCTKNSRVMMHQLSSATWGTLSDMKDCVGEAARQQQILNDIVIKNTKINKKDIMKYMGKNSYFDAKKSLQLGIIDNIAESPNSLYSKLKL